MGKTHLATEKAEPLSSDSLVNHRYLFSFKFVGLIQLQREACGTQNNFIFPSVKTTTCSLSRHLYFPDSFKFVLLYKSLLQHAEHIVLGRIPTKGNDYFYIILIIVVLKPYGPTSIFILRSDFDSKGYHNSVQRRPSVDDVLEHK